MIDKNIPQISCSVADFHNTKGPVSKQKKHYLITKVENISSTYFVWLQWVESMAGAGANQYTFHYEATEDPTGCIRKIREAGMKVRSRKHLSSLLWLR